MMDLITDSRLMNTMALLADGAGGGHAEDSGKAVAPGFCSSFVGLNSPATVALTEEPSTTKEDSNMGDVVNCADESVAVVRPVSTVMSG